MSMIFEFSKMDDAEKFVTKVQERFGVSGKAFADEDAANAHAWTFYAQVPPVAHIDRAEFSTEEEITRLAETTFGGSYLGT